MAAVGNGVLVVFTGIPKAREEEFNRWYDREHVAERVGIPGFLGAQRYRALAGTPPYLALYQTRDLAVFRSAAYQDALANQTEWSRSVMGAFEGTHRIVATASRVRGAGRGAALATLCLRPDPDKLEETRKALDDRLDRLALGNGVVTTILYEADPALSGPPVPLGSAASPPPALEWLIVAETTDEPGAWWARDLLAGSPPEGATVVSSGAYRLLWGLDRSDLPGQSP